MNAEAKRVTKTEVWVGWENEVINGTYPLRRFLGGSNQSAVFLTEYRPEGVTNAAIKLVPADTLETEAQLVQWGTAATLNHPHLVRLFDVGRCHVGGRVFLYVVMEYADQTLAQLLPRRALTPDEARDMLIPTLSALNFLHGHKLVQGQVKPTNLLVVGDQVKLASDTIRSTGKLSSGILRASLHDAPELEDGEIAPAGDIWGLGVTLVEALTQHPPTWTDGRSETVSLTASIPPLFVDTVQRCLNRTPSSRPSAAELQGQFDPTVHAHPVTVVAAEEPVYEISTVSTASEDVPSVRSGPGSGMLVLWAAGVVVLGLAVWVSRTIFVSEFERPSAATVVTGAAAAGTETVGPAARRSSGPRYTVRGAMTKESLETASAAPRPSSDSERRSAGESEVGASGPPAALTMPLAKPRPTAKATDAPISARATSTDARIAAQQPEILGSVLHQTLPDIPRPIREKIRGHVNVTVRVLVDPAGNVVGEFLEKAGPSRYFARQAGDAATEWKFLPTDGNGPRVWMLKFEFTRAAITVRAVGTQ